MIVFNEYKTFIVGTQFGDLLAWKYGGEQKLVHTFSGHLKQVSQIVRHSTKKNIFISASLDCTIKIWCMDVRFPNSNIWFKSYRNWSS